MKRDIALNSCLSCHYSSLVLLRDASPPFTTVTKSIACKNFAPAIIVAVARCTTSSFPSFAKTFKKTSNKYRKRSLPNRPLLRAVDLVLAIAQLLPLGRKRERKTTKGSSKKSNKQVKMKEDRGSLAGSEFATRLQESTMLPDSIPNSQEID